VERKRRGRGGEERGKGRGRESYFSFLSVGTDGELDVAGYSLAYLMGTRTG